MIRLKELRTRKGLTQAKLAKLLKCSNNTISRYELGEREPSFDTLKELAILFETSTSYLLGETDDSSPPQKENASAIITDAEALRTYFRSKKGRDPTPEEFLRIDDFVETFIKGFDK